MKIKKSPIIILFFCYALTALFFAGCIDDVNLEDQFYDTRKLVLYGRLCPQLDTTYILLSSNKLLYGDDSGDFPNISDGIVELSADGVHWIQATYNKTHSRYIITRQDFPVFEGHTYYIRASYPGFKDISASCIVPMTHDVRFRFDTVAVNQDMHWGEVYNWPHKDVYVQWQDVPNEENAYSLKMYYPEPIDVIIDDDEYGLAYGNWRFSSLWLHDGSSQVQYISDKGQDGAVMRFLLEEDIYDNEDWEYEDDEMQPHYYLFFLDRDSYLYESTLNDDGGLNFLLLEPLHTYTNIENGFGLFGAFSMILVK